MAPPWGHLSGTRASDTGPSWLPCQAFTVVLQWWLNNSLYIFARLEYVTLTEC